jgi:hypothetical protein
MLLLFQPYIHILQLADSHFELQEFLRAVPQLFLLFIQNGVVLLYLLTELLVVLLKNLLKSSDLVSQTITLLLIAVDIPLYIARLQIIL